MKKVLFFACILCMFSFSSCEKQKEELRLCSLYGVVTDKTTGELVRDAEVELLPTGQKSVTGSDGSYEFTNLEEGNYTLRVTKSGYKNYESSIISVTGNKSHSLQIEKLPGTVTVVDDNKKEISSIDFGDDPGVTIRSFNIFNNSYETLDWEIQYQCNWIESFSEKDGTLRPNATRAITIK